MLLVVEAVTSTLLLLDDHVGTAILVLLLLLLLRVEHVAGGWLHFLVELEHVDDVRLLPVACAPRMLRRLRLVFATAFLVAEQVVLGLVRVDRVLVPLLFVTARQAVLRNDPLHGSILPRLQIFLPVRHDDLHGFQVLSARTHALH